MSRWFAHIATKTAHAAGHPVAFSLCAVTILLWAVMGPFFGFSDTWQLVINTGTTIVTFLMVFLIQNTQNRDGAAVQAKLDEIIRTGNAQNIYIGIEELTDEEIESFRQRCKRKQNEPDA
jgi:low affinity Fe/Cu permease